MSKLQEAIDVIKAGDKNTGRRLLIEILKADSRNEMAWLWMSQVATNDNDRIKCLRNALKINPDNEIAKRGLIRLQQSPIAASAKPKPVSKRQSIQPTPSKGKPASKLHPIQPQREVEDDRISQQKKERRKKTKFLLYVAASILIVCCLIPFFIATVDVSLRTVGLLPTYTPRPTKPPTLTVTPTGTPTETPIPEPTDTPTNTPTPLPTPALPGLNPADVTLSLKEKGANCTSAKERELYSLKYFVWSCTTDEFGIRMSVDIYARQLQTVDYISAKVFYSDAEIASPFLGFVATAPYSGAERYRARAWVEKTLPEIEEDWDMREETFGGVRFRLSGDAVRHLEMGDLNGIWLGEP